jgi:hypothetical protein
MVSPLPIPQLLSVTARTAAVAHAGEGQKFAAELGEAVAGRTPSAPTSFMLTLVWPGEPAAGEAPGTVGAEVRPVRGTLARGAMEPETATQKGLDEPATEARCLRHPTPTTRLRSPTPRLKTRP